HDELPESAQHLNDLLAEARRRDEEAAALAAGAQYAGDADPYVKPRELDDDDIDDDGLGEDDLLDDEDRD
ncbi:MAG: ribosome-binding factor A, partial [Leucobacter sp.]